MAPFVREFVIREIPKTVDLIRFGNARGILLQRDVAADKRPMEDVREDAGTVYLRSRLYWKLENSRSPGSSPHERLPQWRSTQMAISLQLLPEGSTLIRRNPPSIRGTTWGYLL